MPGLVTNALTNLIKEGNDAQSNLYKLKFSGGVGGIFNKEENSNSITIRNSGIAIPMPLQDTYTVKYITAYIDRPATKVSLDRHFDIEFRVDSNWNIYRNLLKQQNLFNNAAESFASIDISDNNLIKESKFFNVEVEYISELSDSGYIKGITSDAEDDTIYNMGKIARFEYCWIESITPPTFSTSSSDPVKISCSINFLKMNDYLSNFNFGATAVNRTTYK